MVPAWIGGALQAAGLWSIIGYAIRPLFPHLAAIVTTLFRAVNLQGQPSLFNGVLLLLLGTLVRRRKRIGLWAVILILQIWAPLWLLLYVAVYAFLGENLWAFDADQSVAGHFPMEPRTASGWMSWDILTAVTGVAIIVILFLARRSFDARLEKRTWGRAVGILAGGITLATGLGFLLTANVPGLGSSPQDRLLWSVVTALGVNPQDVAVGQHALHGPLGFSFLITLISAASLFLAIVQFTRSAEARRAMTATEELAVRRLLLATDRPDSLGYFATRRDKSVTFSPDGKAAIAYRVIGATALAGADPVGDPASWPDAIESWRQLCRHYGWTQAAIGTSADGTRAYEQAGFRSIMMGDESVVRVDGFTLAGQSMRAVRAEVSHAEHAGYHAIVRHQRDIPADELSRLATAVETWRVGGPERGFSMASSRFGDPSDGSSVVVVAYDESGAARGILSFVPWGRTGLSLDTMRRHPDATGGVTELMIVSLLRTAGDLGVRSVSLNFAMFRRAFDAGAQLGATPFQRTIRRVLMVASRWWQLESLYRSNDKYHPEWQPRLLCYERGGPLSQIALAAARAEGFAPDPARWPLIGRSIADTAADRRDPAFDEEVARQESAASQRRATERPLTVQERDRRKHLDLIVAAGMDPYPVAVPRTVTIGDLRALVSSDTSPIGRTFSVTGRVVRKRDHGGLLFLELREESQQVQAMVRRDAAVTPPGDFELATIIDLGDTVSVTGPFVRTRTGDLAIDATSWTMAAKSLVPMPSKYHGITDPETRLRLRHIDLAIDADAQAMARARTTAVRSIRESFYHRQFIEVETPMLQRIHGGANARPFRTHINAYDLDLYLRIAPELALKRMAVGGLERIFELGRNFRNEGADATHNPEFTSVEAYQAYADYTTMRELTREVIIEAATAVHGQPFVRTPTGSVLDISGDWPVVTVHAAVSAATGHRITPETAAAELRQIAAEHGVVTAETSSAGDILSDLYDKLVEATTEGPTFYIDFPVETSPLTRPHRRDHRLAERWDLVAFGAELGTAYSELIDPIDQRRRLTEQSLRAAAGDPEAMELDEEFLAALEFGMPPTGGLGLGVDRIVMFLTGTSIRQTLAFPFLRPTGR